MSRYYAWHSRIYDATRWGFLFDRDVILKDLQLAPGHTVVEVGCGTGRNLSEVLLRIGPSGKIYAVDCAESMVTRSRGRVRKLGAANIHVLNREYGDEPVAPGHADAVLMSYSLSMIPRWREALQCALGELKPRGRIGVVDFCLERPSPLTLGFARWMAANHVAIDPCYRETLSSVFCPVQCVTRRAFGGLWSFYRFVGERR
jgi:S-adenosylmethionine-diacylgycerolhomoserine-N-methlytransferase